jgi:putative intracellular protease/amidase
MTSYGLLIFEGAEELDFVGPWEVFTVSSMLRADADQVALIAPGPGPVRARGPAARWAIRPSSAG